MTQTVSPDTNKPRQTTNHPLDSPIICGTSSSCATNGIYTSCQQISFLGYHNSTNGIVVSTPSTGSGSRSATLSNSQSVDHTASASRSSSAASTTSSQLTNTPYNSLSSPTPTTKSTPILSVGDGTGCGGGLLAVCTGYDPPSTTSAIGGFPTDTGPLASPSPGGLPPSTTLPIVLPSAFIVIFAIVSAVIGNRRKWASRAYRHMRRERRLRRPPTDASRGDILEDAIPLRNLETPPPAYSPYRFSWVDQEFLRRGQPIGTPPGIDSDMMGHAYPMGDRGRHRSS
jgi:hypothetical protein